MTSKREFPRIHHRSDPKYLTFLSDAKATCSNSFLPVNFVDHKEIKLRRKPVGIKCTLKLVE